VNVVKSSEYSLKKTGQFRERKIYSASAKLEINSNTLTKASQVSNLLAKKTFIKNQYTLYSYSKSKVNRKIEELVDDGILKAEEKALKEEESEGNYIIRVIDSCIELDAETRFLKYATEQERHYYKDKKGYKLVNLSVSIIYGYEEIKLFNNRGNRAATDEVRSKTFRIQKQNVPQYRSAVRSKLLKSAVYY
jgi:hypothetical protein